MAQFELPGKNTLMIEQADKQLRLVISNGTTELACRKVSPSALKRFLASAETSLFKGRLQLHKNNGAVVVALKGEDMGIVALAYLEEMLG
nr:hypothetical protein [uncultured Mucilaginibacter sp.]